MTALPNVDHLSSGAATEAEFQAAIAALHTFTSELMGGAAAQSYSIVAGAVTPTKAIIQVDTEGAAAADDLTNILSTTIGEKVIAVRCASAARVVTLKHLAGGTGQLELTGLVDAILDNVQKTIILQYRNDLAMWVEVSRNWGVFAPSVADQTAVAAAHNHTGTYEPANANLLKKNATAVVTVGYQTGIETIVFASVVTPDFTKQHMKKLAVTGNFTLTAPSSLSGGSCVIQATVDATGGRVMSLSGINVLSGSFDGDANKVNLITLLDWGSGVVDAIIQQRP